jgi:pimeloyl-ACP methyl ester carboxylesterase
LPGYPSSTRAYVRLLDRLAHDWHVVAIDYPGFGQSQPLPGTPTFDQLAVITGKTIDALGIVDYALYMFDFGAPVGFRIALDHDQRVRASSPRTPTPTPTASDLVWLRWPIGGPTGTPARPPSMGSSAWPAPKCSGRPGPTTPNTSTPTR